MPLRQHKPPVATPLPTAHPHIEHESGSSDKDIALHPVEEEFHTDESDEEDGDDAALVADAGPDEDEESLTASEDESDAEPVPSEPLLPAELLKSKSTTKAAPVKISWDTLSRAEKKALRDEMGISMKQLRTQVQGTGVLEAGRAAQVKRGILPATKVAGSRIAKKRKRKGREPKIESSGKQKLIGARKQTASQTGRGSVQPVKKRKG